MSRRRAAPWLLLSAAIVAGGVGLVAGMALFGPGALLNSPPGRWLASLAPRPKDPPGLYVADIGEKSPPLSLPDLQGSLHALPPPGRPVLVNYWASWCGPCREEMPLLASYSRAQSAVEVVGIALDTAEDASAYLAGQPVPFRILLESPGDRDSSVQLGNRRGVLPYSVLIAADGRVLDRRFGAFKDADDLADWAGAASQ